MTRPPQISAYWRGTDKRLIRINWIDILGVHTIHRFDHQLGPGERSGGLSTAKFHVCSARVFSDGSGNPKNTKPNLKAGPDIQNTGQGITNKCKIMKMIDFYAFSDISRYLHVVPTSLWIFCMFFNRYVFKIFKGFLNFPIFPN